MRGPEGGEQQPRSEQPQVCLCRISAAAARCFCSGVGGCSSRAWGARSKGLPGSARERAWGCGQPVYPLRGINAELAGGAARRWLLPRVTWPRQPALHATRGDDSRHLRGAGSPIAPSPPPLSPPPLSIDGGARPWRSRSACTTQPCELSLAAPWLLGASSHHAAGPQRASSAPGICAHSAPKP